MHIIFHSVVPIVEDGRDGSTIRPKKMLDAFRELGCEVEVVDGFSLERKKKILAIKKQIDEGTRFDLMYSESGTDPVFLADPLRRKLSEISLDRDFIKYINQKGIRSGLFYRDIYWKFMKLVKNEHSDISDKVKAGFKIFLRKGFYKYDLSWSNRYYNTIYLPSVEMGRYLPEILDDKILALPPGHDIKNPVIPKNDQLNLIYAGGVTGVYDLSLILDAASSMRDVQLYLCSRENEWKQAQKKYSSTLAENIHNVHLAGEQLRCIYQNMTIACLYLQPNEYRTFAQPVKLYEYIGHGLPILASQGTLAGNMVEKFNIGWSIEYDHLALLELLNRLFRNPSEVEEKRNNVLKIRDQHTWKARARQVLADLAIEKTSMM